jgi:ornithine carbamoyltransferase
MRHLISLKEQSKEDLLTILDLAVKLKKQRNKGIATPYLRDRTLICCSRKTSTVRDCRLRRV